MTSLSRSRRLIAGFVLMIFGMISVLISGSVAFIRGHASGGAWALFSSGLATLEIGRTVVVLNLRGNGKET